MPKSVIRSDQYAFVVLNDFNTNSRIQHLEFYIKHLEIPCTFMDSENSLTEWTQYEIQYILFISYYHKYIHLVCQLSTFNLQQVCKISTWYVNLIGLSIVLPFVKRLFCTNTLQLFNFFFIYNCCAHVFTASIIFEIK